MVGNFVRAIPKMVGHCSLLVGKCPMSDRYFKHCIMCSHKVGHEQMLQHLNDHSF